jgi:lipoic acid synthetase
VSPLGRSSRTRRAVARVDLGRAEYGRVLELQRELRDRRADGSIGDLLITVEHEPVFTIGRRGSRANLLVTEAELAAEGIRLFEVERGGDITYHGPGQLVVYPIVDLRDYGRDLRGYVDRLEEATIRTLRTFGIEGRREPGLPGVWTERGKIASLGVHVRRWITMHGLALNVDVNRRHFAMIRPCGLPVEAVSVSEIAGDTVGLAEVTDRFLNEAEIVFGWRLESVDRRDVAGGADGEDA